MCDIYDHVKSQLLKWREDSCLERNDNRTLKMPRSGGCFNKMLVSLNDVISHNSPKDHEEMEEFALKISPILKNYLQRDKNKSGPLYQQVEDLQTYIRDTLKKLHGLNKNDKYSKKTDDDFKYDIYHKKCVFTGEPLFPHNNKPQPGDVKQTVAEDCYLLAVLKWLARNNPDIIKACFVDWPIDNDPAKIAKFNEQKFIRIRLFKTQEISDGITGVTGERIVIRVDKTRFERSSFFGGNKSALWVQCLEKTWAIYLEKGWGPSQKTGHKKGDKIRVAAINKSAYSDYVIAAITGRMAKSQMIKKPSVSAKKFSGSYSSEAEELYENIASKLNSNIVITAAANSEYAQSKKYKSGLYAGHSYAITKAEEKKRLQIFNN